MSLFGTSGIRGSANEVFTNQFCFDIGRTFAKFLTIHKQTGAVAIGMDQRASGPRIKENLSAGLAQESRQIFDENTTPVPAMNQILLGDQKIAGSIMITGSHIQTDFNGLKFFAFKKEISKGDEEKLEKIYKTIANTEKQTPQKKTAAVENRANAFYGEMLLKQAALPYPKWRVVLDLCNGCQTEIMPTLFEKLGLETILINDSHKLKSFIARDTETEEAVSDLQKEVRKQHADLGVAFDGDGDRVVFVDEDGNFIPGDYSGALLSKFIGTPVIVAPINVSAVIDFLGKPVRRTKVGSPFVVAAIEETGATFGFEANGGGIFKRMLSRDAGVTTIQMLNLLKNTGKSLGQLVSELPQFYLYRTKVYCPFAKAEIIISAAEKEFGGIKTEKIDGLKIWLSDSEWILFRSSQNAPEFRVFAEAKTKAEAEKIGRRGIELVKSILRKTS